MLYSFTVTRPGKLSGLIQATGEDCQQAEARITAHLDQVITPGSYTLLWDPSTTTLIAPTPLTS
jgi:hypothetical protein